MDAIKDAAVEACENIYWKPEWGKERMISMIRERSDWCISRQRTWGVPSPMFYCQDCGKPYCTPESIDKIAAIFEQEGSNAWWARSEAELLPEGAKCDCGCTAFRKEKDILDVWFDSGSTWSAVADAREELAYPADLYLEGGDQYRGWFQSSMLTSIAVNGVAPYRQIITHGWTVDGQGKVMHKSLGNAISPQDTIKDYGADILRLWVSSADYTQDMRLSKPILKQLSDTYLKIRNTCRYILGNLDGFDPDAPVAFGDMLPLDQWAVNRMNALVAECRRCYDNYEFHGVYRAIYNFCVVDMSNFYLDIIKDRLYCEAPDSLLRRSAQSAIFQVLDAMVRLLAPILAFTSEEIWAAMPHAASDDAESVLFNDIPAVDPAYEFDGEKTEYWAQLLNLKADVNKALEEVRAAKIVKKSTDAKLTLYFNDEAWARVQSLTDCDFAALFIVSEVNLVHGDGEGYAGEAFAGLTVKAELDEDPKCPRCWNHHPSIGTPEGHPELCPRCAAVVKAMGLE